MRPGSAARPLPGVHAGVAWREQAARGALAGFDLRVLNEQSCEAAEGELVPPSSAPSHPLRARAGGVSAQGDVAIRLPLPPGTLQRPSATTRCLVAPQRRLQLCCAACTAPTRAASRRTTRGTRSWVAINCSALSACPLCCAQGYYNTGDAGAQPTARRASSILSN